MAKTLDYLSKIETLRAKIDAAKAKRCEIECAPLPRDESIALIRANIQKAAQEWRAEISLSPVRGYPPAAIGHLHVDAPLAAVCPDALEAALVQAVDEARKDYPHGLPSRERPAALAAIDAEILALEIDEERAIVDAEQIGQTIDRRADLDPRAFLVVT